MMFNRVKLYIKRGLIGLTALIVLLFLLAAGWILKTSHEAQALERKSLDNWAKLGRPMLEFGKKLKRVEENESLRALVGDLKPLGIVSLYKAWSGPNPQREDDANTFSLPEEVMKFIEAHRVPGDKVEPSKLEFLEAHSAELGRIYQGILQREPPRWEFHPEDNCMMKVPGYLTLRKLAQLFCADALYRLDKGLTEIDHQPNEFCADALYRLDKGDAVGAAEAVDAGLKMTRNLGGNPLLISKMIKIAIDGLWVLPIERLPENPWAWDELAKDAEAQREQLRVVLQAEAFFAGQYLEREGLIHTGFGGQIMEFLRENVGNRIIKRDWRARIASPLLEMEWAKGSFVASEQVRVLQDLKDYTQGDLGSGMLGKVMERYAAFFPPNASRANTRLNVTLLRREQGEMVRFARARLAEGKFCAEHASVVIPGAKWEMEGDLQTHSAKLKLSPVLEWANDRTVVDAQFWVLPLDGSKPWTFAPPEGRL